MDLLSRYDGIDPIALGNELHQFAAELYPICRSITGAGIRRTLASIQQRIPLEINQVPTGTPVSDWTIPNEWNIRDAFIKATFMSWDTVRRFEKPCRLQN